MAADIETVRATPVRPEIPRDHWGRPLVVPPSGGERVAYTRCTTFVGAVEDTYALSAWQQRHAVRGVALHTDIIDAVRDADPNDTKTLDFLVEEAKTRVGAGDAARLGTYMHAVTEAADLGKDPGTVEVPILSTGPVDPSAYIADLAAYLGVTEPFRHVAVEQFTVQDPLKVGGTPDRVVAYRGKRYIADLKTGNIQYGTGKIAAQLAMYARSRPYDVATDHRLDPHGCETDRGIIIHLPFGSAECRLYWVDLIAGWDNVMTARDVRLRRQKKWAHLTQPLHHIPPGPVSLAAQVTSATTADEVRALWAVHRDEWTDDLTQLAKDHIATLS